MREPLTYRAVHGLLSALIETGRWVIYLTVGFACFAGMSAAYAVYAQGNRDFGNQLLTFAGYILFYLAAPVLAALCLTLFLLELWRLLWGREGFFEENGIRPVEVLVYALLLSCICWKANATLAGRWEDLPLRAATVLQLQLPQYAYANITAPSDQPYVSPLQMAKPARAGLYHISQDAPRLRAHLLVSPPMEAGIDDLSSGLTGIPLSPPPEP